jgi:hypothetical protein
MRGGAQLLPRGGLAKLYISKTQMNLAVSDLGRWGRQGSTENFCNFAKLLYFIVFFMF